MLVGGEPMGGPPEGIPLPPLAAGSDVDVSFQLVAPQKPGRVIGYWRAVSPDGTRFGHRLWVDVVVVPATPEDILEVMAASAAAACTVKPAAAAASYDDDDEEALAAAAATLTLAKNDDEEDDGIVVATLLEPPQDDGTPAASCDPPPLPPPPADAAPPSYDPPSEVNELSLKWSEQLDTLETMGFGDRDVLAHLLEEHSGNVAQALQALFSN